MKRRFFLLLLAVVSSSVVRADVKTGLDVLEESHFAPLWGKRVGVISNRAAVDRSGRPLVDLLREAPGVTLVAVFTPEHGFTGKVENGQPVTDDVLPGTAIPLLSLYGERKRPTQEQLKGIDVLVCDLPDVGTRFYTYITTLGYAMEEAAKADIEFVVLDRPNPLGGEVVEGLVLSTDVRHFTAYYSIPTRHGLTLAEVARWHNQRMNLNARLLPIAMQGWKRWMVWRDTGLTFLSPSPNIRTPTAALLYSGLGAFESTNISVGRGTNSPFGVFGAPWMKNITLVKALSKTNFPGIKLKATSFKPTSDLYKNTKCYGVRVTVTNPHVARPVDLFVHAACLLRDLSPKDFRPRWAEMPRVVGSADFETWFKAGESAEAIVERLHKSAEDFKEERKPFLLYQ
ncbi:MAG: DUF1343 domain-containing protein [Elusimicrobia bacterium]|nr:DUF1343 domain-containing protein [Elusimicrobiota bacterium]